ncbi:MAG TPA: 5-formyltetrahydrofolate cyclo-ligase [Treponemataceae bacterium]|nr:5-formyltetrahydrofolate cyclo-ligase [Treponemataceae bacterium]
MKNELRRSMHQQLKNLPEGVWRPVGRHEQVLPNNTKTLFVYLPFDNEIDPTPLTELALSQGIQVGAPRIVEENLIFHQILSATGPFTSGAYGIREPDANAEQLFPFYETFKAKDLLPLVVLVPGLAFARDGSRLGRGKGYYDRFLSRLLTTYADKREEIRLIGVCHDFQILPSVYTESHDIPVDCLLTSSGVIFY